MNDPKEFNEHFLFWHDFAEKNLFGIEINEQISRTAKMNMIIHDDGHTNVISSDGLISIAEITAKNANFKPENFDYILTNPPFGSSVKVSEKAYMNTDPPYYALAVNEPHWIDAIAKTGKAKNQRTEMRNVQSTEILFIEQCHKFLKSGGWLAIVLPDGVLTNSSLQFVRDWIEEHYRIAAVVSLPQTAFTHTGAGVKSSVLFLRKLADADTQELKNLKKRIRNRVAGEMNLAERYPKLKGDDKDDFREDAEARFQQAYRAELKELGKDYPIFMAVTEYIGYDATGKTIPQNDLTELTPHLAKFITAINHGTDAFFY